MVRNWRLLPWRSFYCIAVLYIGKAVGKYLIPFNVFVYVAWISRKCICSADYKSEILLVANLLFWMC